MEFFEVFQGDYYDHSRLECFDTKAEAERFVEWFRRTNPHIPPEELNIVKSLRFAKLEDSPLYERR